MQRAKPAQRVAGAEQRPSGRGRGARGDHPEKSRRRCGKDKQKKRPAEGQGESRGSQKNGFAQARACASCCNAATHTVIDRKKGGATAPPY